MRIIDAFVYSKTRLNIYLIKISNRPIQIMELCAVLLSRDSQADVKLNTSDPCKGSLSPEFSESGISNF